MPSYPILFDALYPRVDGNRRYPLERAFSSLLASLCEGVARLQAGDRDTYLVCMFRDSWELLVTLVTLVTG